MGLQSTLVDVLNYRVLVAKPNVRQYGHLGLEILMALADARRLGADVLFVHPAEVAGGGLFELESSEVRIRRFPRSIVAAAEAPLRLRDWQDRMTVFCRELAVRFRAELARECAEYGRDRTLPKEVRHGLGVYEHRVSARVEQLRSAIGPERYYFRRRLLRKRVETHLRPEAEKTARAAARAHGIAADARIVCIHARESGYKQGREMQDSKPETGRDDGARNARIESYFAACDYLVGMGYTVVRLGDPSMTPVSRAGIVDLATAPARTNLLEIFLLLRAHFIIAGESGLLGVSYVTNTPLLTVNATEPISAYPIRADGLFMTKKVIDRQTGRRLSQEDLLTEAYQRTLRSTRRYVYVDNTPDEIRAGVREMLGWIDRRDESPGQRAYHAHIVAAAAALQSRVSYIRKWGLDGGFLGDGRIANVALEGAAP
jgi:putative glycosyltransferase (TIGR04372 family)